MKPRSLFRFRVSGGIVFLGAALLMHGFGFSVVRAEEPVAATPSEATAAFAAFDAGKRVPYPPDYRELTKAGRALWIDGNNRKWIEDGVALIEKYPQDPRRWDVVVFLGSLKPSFIKEPGPDFDTHGLKGAVIDEAAAAAWRAKLKQLWDAMHVAPDRTPAADEVLAWEDFVRTYRAAATEAKAGRAVDWTPQLARFDEHLARFAALPKVLIRRADDFLTALAGLDAPLALQVWTKLSATATDESLRTHAASQTKKGAATAAGFELAFTALDGRAVDLARLRGKVVLVDFWATWCGPCIAELPNLKRVYAAYHERGFEVVGIALDREQDRAKLVEFVRRQEMPWPQYFDGGYWNSAPAVKYAVKAIPAMFLIDQQGRIVSTDARGPKLEAEVKRLLGL